jgi:hypothetical protein
MAEADSANGTAPANYRAMLALVIFLGVLILLALGALVGGTLMGAGPGSGGSDAPYVTTLPAGADAWISEAGIDGTRLFVRIDGGGEGGGEVLVLEAATGRVIGRVNLDRTP